LEEVKQLNYNLRVFNTNFHLQMVGGAPMAYSASVAAPMAYSVVPQAKKIAKVKEEKNLTEPNLIALESEIPALVDSKNNRFQTSFIKNFRRLLLFKQIHGHVKVTASTNKKLSSWVHNQRTNLKRYKENEGPLCGNNKFVKLLKKVGVKHVAAPHNT
jgi:hypothetical protein